MEYNTSVPIQVGSTVKYWCAEGLRLTHRKGVYEQPLVKTCDGKFWSPDRRITCE